MRHGLDGFAWQQGRVAQNGRARAQMTKCTQHHGPEDGERAVSVEPLQRRTTHLGLARGQHHLIERLEERLDDDAKHPEFPVLMRSDLDVLVELLLHVVVSMTGDGNASGRQLLLTQTDGGVELFDLLSQPPDLLLHLLPILLQLPDVFHCLLQRHCVTDI